MNCDFTMPNFSKTSMPDAGIEPTSLRWLEDARTKGRVAHSRALNHATCLVAHWTPEQASSGHYFCSSTLFCPSQRVHIHQSNRPSAYLFYYILKFHYRMTSLFSILSLFPPAFLQLVFQPLLSAQTGSLSELGCQVGSTTDHLSSCCLNQHIEDLSTTRVEPAWSDWE